MLHHQIKFQGDPDKDHKASDELGLKIVGAKSPKKKKNVLTQVHIRPLKKEAVYFFDTLSMLLTSGSGVQEALENIKLSASKNLKEICDRMISDLDKGYSFYESMKNTGAFSPYNLAIVKTGEATGRLAVDLELLAENEERRIALKAKIKGAMFYRSQFCRQ